MTSQLTGFPTYQKPGVYTKTIRSSDTFNSFTGFRVPTIVGPASELVLAEDVPVMRGSSSSFPIFVEREDLSYQITPNSTTEFRLYNAPVVNPENALVTNVVQHVEVEIDGVVTNPLSLVGENEDGDAVIQVRYPVEPGSKIYASYYYIRRDREVFDEDLSSQVDGSTTIFYLANKNIVDSSNKGNITNDPAFVKLTINNIATPVSALDGLEGYFIVPTPPSVSSLVKVSYRYSDYRNLSDPLPNKFVQRVVRVGSVPQKSEYVDGVDFSFSSEGSSYGTVNNKISWGNSFENIGLQGKGTSFENDWSLEENIDIQVVDHKVYAEVLKPIFLSSNSYETYTFESMYEITDGTGRGSYLSGSVVNEEVLGVYSGVSAYSALPGGLTVDGNKLELRRVDGKSKRVFLKNPVNPKTTNIYIVYYTNQMDDETYRFTKNTDDGNGNSTYTISSSTYGSVPNTALTSPVASNSLYYPLAYRDYRALSSHMSDEVITVTLSALPAVQITSSNSASGSFLISKAITGTDIVGDLITYTFVSGVARDYFDISNKSTMTVTGMINASNNVVDAEVISAGVNTITVRVSVAGVDEIVAIPSPSMTASLSFDPGKVFKYTVTSNQVGMTGSNTSVNTRLNATLREGLQFNEGVLGEPYVDTTTGFYFNIKYNDDMVFNVGSTFVFTVTKNGIFSNNATLFNIGLRGLRFKVNHLDGVEISEGLTIRTNNYSSDREPSLGDIYYVSYYYYRIDYQLKTFFRFSDVQRIYGRPNLNNPLSLAARLAFDNGAPVVALKPLQWYNEDTLDEYLNREYDPALREIEEVELYKQAIDSLDNPFDGVRRPYFIVPLVDSDEVTSYLAEHVDRMSSPEMQSERFGIVGFDIRRSDNYMMDRARNMNSKRMMMMYPSSAVMNVIESESNAFARAIVPGFYYAVAIAGLASRADLLPSDPLTRKTLTGFADGGRPRNRLALNEIANQGLTIIEKEDPVFRVRHALTTDTSDPLNKEPTATFISDYVQIIARKVNEKFIARPFINSILGEIETVFSAMLNFLQRSGIIVAYRDLEVRQAEDDPTVILVSVGYIPVLPINYIFVTFNLQSRFV